MTFTVTYRAKDGALREECVEALGRSECLAECRRRGIAPTKILEGRSGKSAASPKGPHTQSRLTGNAVVLAAVVLVVVAGGVWWWFGRDGESNPKTANVQQHGAKNPAKPKAEKSKSAVRGNVHQPDGGRGDARLPDGGRGATALPASRSDAPAGASEVPATNSPPRPPVPERVFKTDAEELLAMATPAEPGMDVPPLPPFSEESTSNSAEKALGYVAQATSNDTERTLGIKINVEGQKDELRSLMKEGWTFAQYLEALHKKHTDDAAYVREAQRLDEVLRNDATVSDEEYAAYRKKIDEELKERGLPGLTEAERKAKQEEKENGGADGGGASK